MKGEPPVVGITKLKGVTLEELKRPRKKLPVPAVPLAPEAIAPSTNPAPPSP